MSGRPEGWAMTRVDLDNNAPGFRQKFAVTVFDIHKQNSDWKRFRLHTSKKALRL